MSQHFYPATYKGEPVTVLMGYDRPLRGFFMVIEKTGPASAAPTDADDDQDEADTYVYSNLSDMELIACGGLPRELDHFLQRLKELDIPAHASVIAGIQADRAGNVGNRYVSYDAAGNVLGDQAGK